MAFRAALEVRKRELESDKLNLLQQSHIYFQEQIQKLKTQQTALKQQIEDGFASQLDILNRKHKFKNSRKWSQDQWLQKIHTSPNLEVAQMGLRVSSSGIELCQLPSARSVPWVFCETLEKKLSLKVKLRKCKAPKLLVSLPFFWDAVTVKDGKTEIKTDWKPDEDNKDEKTKNVVSMILALPEETKSMSFHIGSVLIKKFPVLHPKISKAWISGLSPIYECICVDGKYIATGKSSDKRNVCVTSAKQAWNSWHCETQLVPGIDGMFQRTSRGLEFVNFSKEVLVLDWQTNFDSAVNVGPVFEMSEDRQKVWNLTSLYVQCNPRFLQSGIPPLKFLPEDFGVFAIKHRADWLFVAGIDKSLNQLEILVFDSRYNYSFTSEFKISYPWEGPVLFENSNVHIEVINENKIIMVSICRKPILLYDFKGNYLHSISLSLSARGFRKCGEKLILWDAEGVIWECLTEEFMEHARLLKP